jgi:hypothetical protein
MIIIYKEFKGDKAEFTKKEIEELLEKARQEGYDEGYSKGYSKGYSDNKGCTPITYPTTPISPTCPNYPIFTCNANRGNLN